MKHALFRGCCVIAMTFMALSTPKAAAAKEMGDCGTWCVYGQPCSLELIQTCYQVCTNSHGGACGGSCGGGAGVILYCSGDET